MRQGLFFSILLTGIVCNVVWAVGGDMGGGTEPLTDGSKTYPYRIEDLADFDTFAGDSSYWADGIHTKLMTDIDLAGRTYTTAVVAPDTDPNSIYFQGNAFQGVFDGNNHIISNLNIVSSTGDYIGLFGTATDGYWNDGTIENLGVVNISLLSNGSYVGGIAGASSYLDITNCYVTGSVNGASRVGGMVGEFKFYGNLTQSYVSGSVSGIDHIGGLTGWSELSKIYRCHADITVNGTRNVGGVVGSFSSPGTITSCYATGSVNGVNYVGGVVGFVFFVNIVKATANNCYAATSVTGNTYIGGFCGGNSIFLIPNNCFWDIDVSGIGSSGNMGKTSVEMMTQSTFTGWDFVNDWMMLREGEDYPRLAWQEVFDGDIAGLYGVDMVDFSYLANYWGLDDCNGLEDCGRADTDSSGDVGQTDLINIAEDWLRGIN